MGTVTCVVDNNDNLLQQVNKRVFNCCQVLKPADAEVESKDKCVSAFAHVVLSGMRVGVTGTALLMSVVVLGSVGFEALAMGILLGGTYGVIHGLFGSRRVTLIDSLINKANLTACLKDRGAAYMLELKRLLGTTVFGALTVVASAANFVFVGCVFVGVQSGYYSYEVTLLVSRSFRRLFVSDERLTGVYNKAIEGMKHDRLLQSYTELMKQRDKVEKKIPFPQSSSYDLMGQWNRYLCSVWMNCGGLEMHGLTWKAVDYLRFEGESKEDAFFREFGENACIMTNYTCMQETLTRMNSILSFRSPEYSREFYERAVILRDMAQAMINYFECKAEYDEACDSNSEIRRYLKPKEVPVAYPVVMQAQPAVVPSAPPQELGAVPKLYPSLDGFDVSSQYTTYPSFRGLPVAPGHSVSGSQVSDAPERPEERRWPNGHMLL